MKKGRSSREKEKTYGKKKPRGKRKKLTAKEKRLMAKKISPSPLPLQSVFLNQFNISSYERLVVTPTCFAFDSQSQAEMDKLTCYYYNKHPLLVLNPAKIEMANLKPNIYLLHDIIRDEDMEFIKESAAPRVCDANVNLTLNNKGWTINWREKKRKRVNREGALISILWICQFFLSYW